MDQTEKERKSAPTCVNRLGTITAGSCNFDCNNARCWNPLCWHDLGLVALPTELYLQHYLVSFVRGTCVLRLCCRFHWQEKGFRRFDLKIEVARDFYVSKERISTFWGCLSTPRLLEESSLRRVTVADFPLAHELHRLAASNFPASYLNLSLKLGGSELFFLFTTPYSNSVSFHFTQTFPEKSLLFPIMPCSRAFFN